MNWVCTESTSRESCFGCSPTYTRYPGRNPHSRLFGCYVGYFKVSCWCQEVPLDTISVLGILKSSVSWTIYPYRIKNPNWRGWLGALASLSQVRGSGHPHGSSQLPVTSVLTSKGTVHTHEAHTDIQATTHTYIKQSFFKRGILILYQTYILL